MEQEWLMIDMHMHSYYSSINKPSEAGRVKQMTAKEFVDIMISNGIKIFSITDHNYYSSEFYDQIDKYINDNKLKIKIINGVEFDAFVDMKDGNNNYIHICIYFDDSVDRKQLEKNINELYKDSYGNALTPNFVDILNKLHKLNTKYIVIPHGDKDRGLFKKHFIDDLNVENVKDYYKYAMYKIFNGFDVSPKFYGKSEEFWATSFFEKTKKFNEFFDNKTEDEINIIKDHISSKIKDKTYLLTKDENEIYDYILKYGAYFAYFSFSDWHNKGPYSISNNNFIFGSLKTAFSSFEMSTLDPVSRIIQSDDKEISIPNTILNKVKFEINGDINEISFSPGLNAIVGKRGSGKSLLLSVIRNLVDKNDPLGALQMYKILNINNISAQNRDGINISLGSLNSVAFLTQDEIKDIFENPEKAQKTISSYFVDIKDIDLTLLEMISKIGNKIKPINENYKNLTSNILAIKKFDNYNYAISNVIDSSSIKANFNIAINNLSEVVLELQNNGFNIDNIENDLNKIKYDKDMYLKMIDLYNNVITNKNKIISDINSKRSSNQVARSQNIQDIKNSLKEINNNFEILLNIKKLNHLIDIYKLDNPPVELNQKGNYLFVTYYEIPNDINQIITEKILDTIKYSGSIEDIYNYAMNKSNKVLKTSATNLMSEFDKFIKNADVFKAKKEFYEIKNKNIDYKSNIKTMEDLKKNIKLSNIINLTDASPGMKSVAYLDMLFDLDETILILDQPEDNIDNDYISNYLVPNIKEKKKVKQLIFVTHNPSVAVYGDAFNYIFAENNEKITYKNYFIEKREDKEKLIKILEGGRRSFSNRNKKFGDMIGEEEYGIN